MENCYTVQQIHAFHRAIGKRAWAWIANNAENAAWVRGRIKRI